jgi:carnosine N-methyltransferase
MRDWSAMGAAERSQCYQPIIDEIMLQFPEDKFDRLNVNVLVPGAGLGRLAFEIATLGFACQGNEFNLFMLIVSYYVLNHCKKVDEYIIYPWIHQYCNNLSAEHQMTSVR